MVRGNSNFTPKKRRCKTDKVRKKYESSSSKTLQGAKRSKFASGTKKNYSNFWLNPVNRDVSTKNSGRWGTRGGGGGSKETWGGGGKQRQKR